MYSTLLPIVMQEHVVPCTYRHQQMYQQRGVHCTLCRTWSPPEPHALWAAQTLMSYQDRASTHLLSCWVGVVALVGGWEGQVEGVEEMVALLLSLCLTLSNYSRLQGNSACQSGSESIAMTCAGTNDKVLLAVQAFALSWHVQQSLHFGQAQWNYSQTVHCTYTYLHLEPRMCYLGSCMRCLPCSERHLAAVL